MKHLFTLFVLLLSMNGFSQKKNIQYEISGRVNNSVGSDQFKTIFSPDNVQRVSYPSSKKWEHPFYSLTGIATKPITKNISVGLSSGIYLFDKEEHYLGIKRTFVAIPIQTVFDYHLQLKEHRLLGARISPGILMYKIDDFFIKVNNAFVVDGELYYKFSPRSKFQVGWNQIVENASMDFPDNNPNSSVKKDFSLNRSAVYLGYSFLIN